MNDVLSMSTKLGFYYLQQNKGGRWEAMTGKYERLISDNRSSYSISFKISISRMCTATQTHNIKTIQIFPGHFSSDLIEPTNKYAELKTKKRNPQDENMRKTQITKLHMLGI